VIFSYNTKPKEAAGTESADSGQRRLTFFDVVFAMLLTHRFDCFYHERWPGWFRFDWFSIMDYDEDEKLCEFIALNVSKWTLVLKLEL
jgi:hypothetical protein